MIIYNMVNIYMIQKDKDLYQLIVVQDKTIIQLKDMQKYMIMYHLHQHIIGVQIIVINLQTHIFIPMIRAENYGKLIKIMV